MYTHVYMLGYMYDLDVL